MSTLKVNRVQTLDGSEFLDINKLAAYGNMFHPGWDGIPLDETTSPKLTDLPVKTYSGLEAKMYPDGSIVGSNAYGEFRIYPNGNMDCSIYSYTSAAPTVKNLPLIFIATPREYYATMKDGSYASIVYAYACSTSTISTVARAVSSGASATRVCIAAAYGRWK